jgi:hypothetical protein
MEEPSKYDVFLSYSRSDSESAELVAERLSSKGLDVWLDKWSLVPGAAWQTSIHKAIDGASSVAVLMGPSGVDRFQEQELDEIIRGRTSGRGPRVILVLLPGVHMEPSTPFFLRERKFIDMRTGLRDDQAWRSLISAIESVEARGERAVAGE